MNENEETDEEVEAHFAEQNEVKKYFETMQEDLGTSNSGSEAMLNAPLVIVTSEV